MLRENVVSLSESFFFNPSISRYLLKCQDLIDKVLSSYESIDSNLSARISWSIWQSIKYISGSTSSKIPYEIVYALESALSDWSDQKHVICTALLDDRDFHFNGLDLKKQVQDLVDFDDIPNLIHIALPKIYRHKYLYGPALYHELGHYIDSQKKISEISIVIDDDFKGTTPKEYNIELSHRSEFFADIFAASYVGESIGRFLINFAEGHGDSDSHPATVRRVTAIKNFLGGLSCPEIDRINTALQEIGLPILKLNLSRPDVTNDFDNVRTYKINDINELHGIIPASWDYIDKISNTDTGTYATLNVYNREKAINDLVEKSVRNWIIKEKWDYGTSN